MKKIVPFCTGLAFLLAVSGGANAALAPVPTFTLDLGTISGTTAFANIFDTDDGITNPFPFSDVYLYKPVSSATSVSTATTFQVVIRNISSFTGWIYVGVPTGTLVASQALFDLAPAGTAFFNLTALGGTACVPGLLTCTINMSALTAGGAQHFLHFTGTADGSQGPDNVFGDYAGTITVPIPPAAVLFLSALAGLAGFSRIRRRKAVA